MPTFEARYVVLMTKADELLGGWIGAKRTWRGSQSTGPLSTERTVKHLLPRFRMLRHFEAVRSKKPHRAAEI